MTRAVRQREFGAADVLVLEDVPTPEPGEGQVRIRVGAAGVHLVDTAIRSGTGMGPFPLPELPMTPGREVAGVVDAVGPGVDATWAGKRVVAHLGTLNGGYAEEALAAADALHELPDHLDARTAVAMMGTGRMTMGLLGLAPVRAGETVLVLAAAVGIGTLLVQAALHAGASVIGAAGGPEKVARVRAAGARAVDYAVPGRKKELDGVDLVFDGVGGEAGVAAFGALNPGGRFVVHGFSGGAPTPVTTADLLARSLTDSVGLGPSILKLPSGLRGLEEAALAAAASGELVPAVTEYRLADLVRAHTDLEQRRTVGKVVLVP